MSSIVLPLPSMQCSSGLDSGHFPSYGVACVSLISLMTQNFEHLFKCLFSKCTSSLTCPLRPLAQFLKIGCSLIVDI